ncbi:MAG TPA: DUF4267 domain-containing protein [Solirubrobacteraceae bacterium]
MPTSPAASLPQGRIVIGLLAWFLPNVAARAFGLKPKDNPQASFITRLFGIRDATLGVAQMQMSGPARRLAWQLGIVVDAADAAAAALAARNGTMSKPTAVLAGGIALAAVAMGVAALQEE